MARHAVTLAALCFAASVLMPFGVSAQGRDTAATRAPEGTATSLQRDSASVPDDAFALPPVAEMTEGDRVIPAGTTETGTVAIRKGNLEVRGTVTGDAIAVDGDVIIHQGGLVRGSAVAVRGDVRLEGGSVLGEILTTTNEAPGAPAAPQRSPAAATRHALALAVGWLAVIAVIGIGVLIFGSEYLEGTSTALERRFTRSFWMGVAGQLALLPLLLALIVGLAITILGILLIPFAIVAYMLAVAGVLTLGFLAVARVTGAVLNRPSQASGTARAALLRSLAIGIVVYLGFWILAAAFAWNTVLHMALSGIAFVVTWVAVTAGLGAAIISRAGTRPVVEPNAAPAPVEELAWQTPTPIGGVVAARRPTSRVKEPR